jgi:maltooligosyltrehalose trehalohydrolase
MAEIARQARAAAVGRQVYLVAENEPQNARLIRSVAAGGYGLDAMWNDDFHHTAVVALTGRREAYYADYKGTAQELVSCAKYGFLYQGQWYTWQKKRRGTPALDLPPHVLVAYLENHDQVANSLFGRRLHQISSPARYRAFTALVLLGPATPMLFQGQELSSSAPFLFFADHRDALRESVRTGRREFLSQFASLSDPDVDQALPSPVDEATFLRAKLDLSERQSHAEAWALHKDLLTLRRATPAITHPRRVDGAVLAPDALGIRYSGDEDDCLLVVNLGCDLDLVPAPEPLLAPPAAAQWTCLWSSETIRYGGQGTPPVHANSQWHLPGESAVFFRATAASADDDD